MTHIRKKAIEGLNVGDTFSVSRKFTERDVILFADITRDYNPVHFDERFTEVKGIQRSYLPWAFGGKYDLRNWRTNWVVGLGNEFEL